MCILETLGGITELERQLKLDDGSKEATTPAISRNLYNKVFSNPGSNRYSFDFTFVSIDINYSHPYR